MVILSFPCQPGCPLTRSGVSEAALGGGDREGGRCLRRAGAEVDAEGAGPAGHGGPPLPARRAARISVHPSALDDDLVDRPVAAQRVEGIGVLVELEAV